MADINKTKNYYSINENLKTVENGPVTLQQAYSIIDRYIEYQIGLKGDAGYVISKSMFGFSADENTFVEISLDDEHAYRIKFESPKKNYIKILIFVFNLYQKELMITDKNILQEIVKNYYALEVDEFRKYFDAL